jgi:hypothetical protein
MKLIKILSVIFLLIFVSFLILINGFKTSSFNSEIKEEIEKKIPAAQVNFDDIKISLKPSDFTVEVKINNPKFSYKKKKIDTKKIYLNLNLISFIQDQNKKPKSALIEIEKTDIQGLLLFMDEFNLGAYSKYRNKILSGFLEGNINIDFENNNNIKFEGILNDATLQIHENFPFATKIDSEFKYKNSILDIRINNGKFSDLKIKQSRVSLNHNNLDNILVNTDIFINGSVNYLASLKGFKSIASQIFSSEIENLNGNIDLSIILDLSLDKNFVIKKIKSNSKFKIKNAGFDFYLKKKKSKEKITISKINSISELKDKNISTNGKFLANNKKINFSFNNQINSKNFNGSFSGSIDTKDLENYFKFDPIQGLVAFKVNLKRKQNKNNTNVILDLEKSLVQLKSINYKKKKNVKATLNFVIDDKSKDNTTISRLNYISKDAKISFTNLFLDKKYKIENFKSINIQTEKNSIILKKNKSKISIIGDSLDLRKFVKLLASRKDKKKFISKNLSANIEAKIKTVYVGDDTINKVVSAGSIKNGKYESLNVFGAFSETETATIEIARNKKNNLVTRIVSDRSRPVLSGLNFAKTFSNGKVNFVSEKLNKENSKTVVTLSNFYVKKMPVLANLLSLTSFTGLVDTLSGKGVFFEKSYLEYSTKNKTLKIIDAYGTGDSLGYILEGSIGQDGFVSIRGNLVPAYLVNNIIRQIPIIGKAITGKQGDGIFGASFKLKGQPGSLKTTVNPIKTLTPRFIQRFFGLFKKKSK